MKFCGTFLKVVVPLAVLAVGIFAADAASDEFSDTDLSDLDGMDVSPEYGGRPHQESRAEVAGSTS